MWEKLHTFVTGVFMTSRRGRGKTVRFYLTSVRDIDFGIRDKTFYPCFAAC